MSFRPPGRYFPAGAALPPQGIPPTAAMSKKENPLALNQSSWQSIPFQAGTSPTLLQPYTLRKFLLIQNRDAAETIYIGFGWTPTTENGLILAPGFSYEPFAYPVNEIYIMGSAPDTAGLLIFGV